MAITGATLAMEEAEEVVKGLKMMDSEMEELTCGAAIKKMMTKMG